jgi:hypothetical protein
MKGQHHRRSRGQARTGAGISIDTALGPPSDGALPEARPGGPGVECDPGQLAREPLLILRLASHFLGRNVVA